MADAVDRELEANKKQSAQRASELLKKSSKELLENIFYYQNDKLETFDKDRPNKLLAYQSALQAKLSQEAEKTSRRMFWLNIILAIIGLSVFFSFPKIAIFGGDKNHVRDKHTTENALPNNPNPKVNPIIKK
jgi:hypothetical protein